MIEKEVLDAIAENLRGQCVHDIEFFCEERGINYDDLTLEDLQYIDNIVFCCAGCGWWCEIGDVADGDQQELYCSDCGEDDDE